MAGRLIVVPSLDSATTEALLTQDHDGLLRLVRSEKVLLDAGSSRDVSAVLFSAMAEEYDSRRVDEPPLVIQGWPSGRLEPAHERMLERAALGLGAVVAGIAPPPVTHGPQNRPKFVTNWPIFGAPRVPDPTLDPGWLRWTRVVGWPNHGPGAGAFRRGATLLVGERPNVAKSGELKHRLPFVTFGGAQGCAEWVTMQMARYYSESDLYWINAYDAIGEATDDSFIEELQPGRVIAMGKLAERWCSDALLDFDPIPHPQYWKRFHHNEPYPLHSVM